MHREPDLPDDPDDGGRRRFLQSAGALVGASLAPGGEAGATPSPAGTSTTTVAAPPAPGQRVVLRVNGQRQVLHLEPRVTLLDALREHLHLMGTKKGCDRGQCGACTVLVNDQRIDACLTLAVMHEGDDITTIEGLGTPDHLHPVQAAFIAHDAFQCGYCTPGQVCSAVAMLREAAAGDPSAATPDVRDPRPALTDDEVRERMSGNLCRCGAYPNIVAALQDVHRRMPGAPR